MRSSHPLSEQGPTGGTGDAVWARAIQAGLLGIIVLALAGLVVATIEGRAGWVYVAIGLFMVAGVGLAIHTALVASRPRIVMRTAGFAPTRAAGVWRAIVEDVPIEARLSDGIARFRAEGIPDGLRIEAGDGGRPTGAPDFDAVARCAGRRAWIAALGPDLRAHLIPLLALGARVEGGGLHTPMGGVDLVHAAATTTARLGRTYRDLKGALVDRMRRDSPADGSINALAALAAGWPEDAATVALGDALLAHADPTIRLEAGRAIGARAAEVLAALHADDALDADLRRNAFVARIAATVGEARRRALVAAAADPLFAAEAQRLAATHGVVLKGGAT